MAVDWAGFANASARIPSFGEAFNHGMEQGRQRRFETDQRNALAAYAQNPNEQSLNALAQFQPEFVVQQKQQQAQMAEQQQAKRLDLIGKVAAGVANLSPEAQAAGWDQGVAYLSQFYPELAEQQGQYSPEALQSILAATGNIPKQPEAYTLSPGSRRYDANGRLIAEAPFAPHYGTVSEGQTAFMTQPGGGAPADPDIIFQRMIGAESNGQQFGKDGRPLTSPAGAIGIAQVMPGTAPEAAALAGLPFDENAYRNDPQYNAALGQAYFQKQLQDFGDPAQAVAAYNAGPGAVQRAIQRGGQNWLSLLPAETKAYVAKVMGGGGAKVVAQGAPKVKEKWRQLTQQEAQQRGLPDGAVYQESPTGEIKPLSGGTGGMSKQQIGAARQKLKDIAPIENQLARVERAMEAAERGGWTGVIGGRIPGNLDAESDTFDKSVRMLATLVRKLTRTPGEGSMSDYESRLAEMTLPSRTDTPEGRREAIAGIRDLIVGIKSGYEELAGPMASPAPKPPASTSKTGFKFLGFE